MKEKLVGNGLYAVGGGPTAVINKTLRGVALGASRHKDSIVNLYGSVFGVKGIKDEKFVDLRRESPDNLLVVSETPGAALGSARWKPNEQDCDEIFKVFEKYNIRYFFFNGGNDTAEAFNILKRYAEKETYEIRMIHLAKTIDNDLEETDFCPGYPSASKYVIARTTGDNMDTLSLEGLKINIIMGRHVGWLTASTSLAKESDGDAPHGIFVPERQDYSIKDIFSVIENAMTKYGRCVLSISEGLVLKEMDEFFSNIGEASAKLKESGNKLIGDYLESMAGSEKDGFGHIQLSGTGVLGDYLAFAVRTSMKIKRVRADTFGYSQRSMPGFASEIDQKEAEETGEKGVDFAVAGLSSVMVGLERHAVAGTTQFLKIPIPIEKVAAKEKKLPDSFMNADKTFTTQKFRDYLKPLIGTLPRISHLNMVGINE